MRKTFRFLLGLPLALTMPLTAQAATVSLSIVIATPSATSVTCPITATLTAPVAAGTVLCALTVAPSSWSGALVVSGTNANLFSISSTSSGSQLVVGASPITAPGTYAATITATP